MGLRRRGGRRRGGGPGAARSRPCGAAKRSCAGAGPLPRAGAQLPVDCVLSTVAAAEARGGMSSPQQQKRGVECQLHRYGKLLKKLSLSLSPSLTCWSPCAQRRCYVLLRGGVTGAAAGLRRMPRGRWRPGAALIDVRLDVGPLPPCSSSPTVAGCRLGGIPVVIGGVESALWEGFYPALTLAHGVCVIVYV